MKYKKKTLIIFVLLFVIFINQNAFAKPILRNDNNDNLICLTFDDGPSQNNIKKIIDILNKYEVKATFFVVGEQVKYHPESLKLINDNGHEIANHTYNHVYINQISENKLIDEVSRTDDEIFNITGKKTKLFRAPGGMISDNSVKTIEKLGYKLVLWSVDTKDWSRPSYDKMVENIEKNTTSGDIILFHDLDIKEFRTPDVLEEIIPYLKNKGYQFVTCSELLSKGTV